MAGLSRSGRYLEFTSDVSFYFSKIESPSLRRWEREFRFFVDGSEEFRRKKGIGEKFNFSSSSIYAGSKFLENVRKILNPYVPGLKFLPNSPSAVANSRSQDKIWSIDSLIRKKYHSRSRRAGKHFETISLVRWYLWKKKLTSARSSCPFTDGQNSKEISCTSSRG